MSEREVWARAMWLILQHASSAAGRPAIPLPLNAREAREYAQDVLTLNYPNGCAWQ